MGKQFKIYSLIIAVVLMISLPAFAEVTDYQVGARPIGMGGAFVSIADDANAAYWNPAGLENLEGFGFTSMYAQMFGMDELTLSYVAVGLPLENFGLGLSYIGEAGKLEDWSGAKDTYNINRIGLAGSYNADGKLILGSSVNYYNYKNLLGTKGGFSADFGFQYKHDYITAGAVAKNLFAIIPGEKINPMFQFGVSYQPEFPVVLAAEVSMRSDISNFEKTDFGYHLGAEYTLAKLLQVRAGYTDGNLTGGLGVQVKWFKFDYGYSMHQLGATHRISGGLQF